MMAFNVKPKSTAAAVALALLTAPAAYAQNSDITLAPTSPQEGAIAVVNDDVISTVDLRSRVALILVTTGLRPTSQDMLRQIQGEALQNLVDERVKLQEAERLGLEISEQEVTQTINELAQNNQTSIPGLEQELLAMGGNIRSLQQQIRADLAWQRLLGARYGSRLRISDNQIQNTLDRIAASANKPQYLVSEIVLDIVPGKERDTEGLALRLIDEMKNGAPFPALAQQFSGASTAANGGDIGWVSAGEMDVQMERVLNGLRPGQVSRPFVTPDGIKILALREKRQGTVNRVRYDLKQAVIPIRDELGTPAANAAEQQASATLNALRARMTGCDDFEEQANKIDGVKSGGINDIAREQLAQVFQDAIDPLDAQEISAPVRTRIGVHLLGVCKKHVDVGGALPSKDEIALRLQNQQLAMISKRYLRDLKRSATIEGR